MKKEHLKILDDLLEGQIYQRAEQKAEAYGMNNTQVYGLENIFNSSENVELLKRFLDHQRTKATKRDDTRAANFFGTFYNEFNKELPEILKVHLPDLHKDEKNEVLQYLIKGYLQHFLSHHVYHYQR